MILQQKIVLNVLQLEALKRIDSTMNQGVNRATIMMPTGTGKTFLSVVWFKERLEEKKDAKLQKARYRAVKIPAYLVEQ